MVDPYSIGTIAKFVVETRGLGMGSDGIGKVALEALRGQITSGSVLDRLASEAGWSVAEMNRTADMVLNVEGSATTIVETSLTPEECTSVHEAASKETPHNRQSEVLGLESARLALTKSGYTSIHVFGGGGPGGAMPDIICRGPDGRLTVVEVKGTQTGTKLKDAGLDRGPDGAGGTRWENCADWLKTGGAKTLEAMDAKLAECPDPGLPSLLDEYAELVDNGFDDRSAYGNVVVQAGDHLTPLNASQGKVADFIREAQPDCILQVHTDV